MTGRVPLVPTIVVAAAVAVMIGLGVWQLDRAAWKKSLLTQYSQARDLPPIAYPTMPLADDRLPLFRHATGVCLRRVGSRAVAGQNASGEPGYVHIVECTTGAEGPGMSVVVGWSKDPNAKVIWDGGPVSGIIAPDSRSRMRLVAATAPPGLQPAAPPSVQSIPNNHMFYALQWFLFAGLAELIYFLALRKRWQTENSR
jgi:cytochrome oxidase assembly protein ShyY1